MWTEHEHTILRKLRTPTLIQNYLDSLPYDPEDGAKSPRYTIREHKAHCFGGALLAAAALAYHSKPPLIIDLSAINDDDHIIAVYKHRGMWGAIAKSNFTTLRSREPIYRTVRELALSYFDFYLNTKGEKTLRSYSMPVRLKRFPNWETAEGDLDIIQDAMNSARHFSLVPRGLRLSSASELLLKASLLGANHDGLYKAR